MISEQVLYLLSDHVVDDIFFKSFFCLICQFCMSMVQLMMDYSCFCLSREMLNLGNSFKCCVHFLRCIPFRYRNSEEVGESNSGKVVEVLMISSSSGPGLLFPKVTKL